MKTSNNYNSEEFDRCPFHSNINAGNDIDLVYKKTYSNDWGHWDDLPDNNTDHQHAEEAENDTNAAEGLCS